METQSGWVDVSPLVSRSEVLRAFSKSESEDSGVEMASGDHRCPLSSGSEGDLARLSRASSLQQLPRASESIPLARHWSELELGRGLAEGPVPQLEPIQQKLQRALQRTLSRKRGWAAQAWEGGSPLPSRLQSPLLSARPLAHSQPGLADRGEQGGLGPPTTNSASHPKERGRELNASEPGLRYLQQVCRLLDRIADLQECNIQLRRDKMEMEEILRQTQRKQEMLRRHCCCGSASLLLPPPHTRDPRLRLLPAPHRQHWQRRWASDSSIVREAKAGSPGPDEATGIAPSVDETDSRPADTEDVQAGRGHAKNRSSMMMKNDQSHWGRVRELVSRLKPKAAKRQSVVLNIGGDVPESKVKEQVSRPGPRGGGQEGSWGIGAEEIMVGLQGCKWKGD
ncbi:uncharacterized protein si:dkey-106l3.7 [Pristis pectinata]|uniref:uncharacterized protein si:dkey-106l3.7 n=1 Tax=Pristis pectinata TaxID=685728 RepID=UPI00223D0A3E|nr:uncharacterized protein si:dkey-106l3.7 [Pristis pectinata]